MPDKQRNRDGITDNLFSVQNITTALCNLLQLSQSNLTGQEGLSKFGSSGLRRCQSDCLRDFCLKKKKMKKKKKKQRKKEKINSTLHRIYRSHSLLDESIQNALLFANYFVILVR